jgi:hypothetical protein
MSVVEQRYCALSAVQSCETAGVVAAQLGVSRQSVQNRLRRQRDDDLVGLELMRRMGHASMRAALIYQHASDERDRAIADSLSAHVERSRPADEDEEGDDAAAFLIAR